VLGADFVKEFTADNPSFDVERFHQAEFSRTKAHKETRR